MHFHFRSLGGWDFAGIVGESNVFAMANGQNAMLCNVATLAAMCDPGQRGFTCYLPHAAAANCYYRSTGTCTEKKIFSYRMCASLFISFLFSQTHNKSSHHHPAQPHTQTHSSNAPNSATRHMQNSYTSHIEHTPGEYSIHNSAAALFHTQTHTHNNQIQLCCVFVC